MSLTETFVQLIESDISQTNGALDNLRRSTDDIVDDIKQAQQNTLTFGSLLKEMWPWQEQVSGGQYIEFESNAGEVTKQTGEMSTKLSAIVTSLVQFTGGESDAVFKALKQNYDDLQNSISETRRTGEAAAAAEISAQKKVQSALRDSDAAWQSAFDNVAALAEKSLNFAGISTTITGLISDAAARAAEIESIDKLGREINITTQDVDAFSGSVAALGGTRSAAQADLSAMAKAFGFAGDSMEKVLQTADKVQGMSFSEAKKTLGGLGVEDNGTVEMLMKGREELSRMMETQKDYGGITRESIEQSISFNNAMLSLEQSAGLLKNSLMGMLIPALAQGLDWLEKIVVFAKENKNFVTGFFIAVAAVVTGKYVHAMKLAQISTWTAMLPVMAVVAGILLLAAVFALVYDDIMNFIDGNDSMIGRILDSYPGLKAVILTVWEAFVVLFDFIMSVIGVVADIVVAAYNTMNTALNEFIDWLTASIQGVMAWGAEFEAVFDTVSDAVVGIFTWLWEQIEEILGWISKGMDLVKEGWSTVKGWVGMGDSAEIEQNVNRTVTTKGKLEYSIPETPSLSEEETLKLAGQITGHVTTLAANPMASLTSGTISNQSAVSNENIISVGEISIVAKDGDPQTIAADIVEVLRQHIENMGHEYNSGMEK
ncbi:hypothetical protein ISO71_17500 [Morganella morganii subsp. morganii]|uniref:hypothetical protein n=1 Tax=Morganella morganii TaxID=582 RepID=UPI000661FE19|nr:hypothetical protein [Morganella morganii]AVD60353.1 hypothetical protein C4E49_13545 [Morganella morganii]MBT0429767.1 hypothetical protein [Morganella morganii subsp. morganii]MBT0477425.1 hypothetical protein [Morganella morganii subsp. morganii]MBT0502606.1 hypothetical protein [Morganella morganii subsp. morganii]MBT0524504.1 hypothetical protein [Morganella morganii subsp. morganii]